MSGECSGGSCEIKGFAPPRESPPAGSAIGSGWEPSVAASEIKPGFGVGAAGLGVPRAPAKPPGCPLTLYFSEHCRPCAQAKQVIQEEKLLQQVPQQCLDMKEIDQSEENYDEWERLSFQKCQGVPFFVNKATGRSLCGFSNSRGDFAERFQLLATGAAAAE